MKKVIAYLRVSTEMQDLERQRKQVCNYCDEQGYNLIHVIEEKVSGAKINRKGINELLDFTNDDADLVIVSEQSRFSREKNIVKVLMNISNVLENGLDLVFLDNPTKVYKAGTEIEFSDLVLLMAGAYASNLERDKIAYRMQSGKEALFYSHPYAYMKTSTLFGFDVVPNPDYIPTNKDNTKKQVKQLIQINPKEADLIRKMFDLYVNHNYLAKDLQRFLADNGCNITESSIHKLLLNRLYIGERYYKGKLVHTIDAIVDKELFDKVPYIKKRNVVINDNVADTINPFKGLIKCSCGSSYILLKRRTGQKGMTCSNRVHSKGVCSNYGFLYSTLLSLGKCIVTNQSDNVRYNEETAKLLERYSSLKDELNNIINNIKSDIGLNNTRINNITGLIIDETDKRMISGYKSKLEELYNNDEHLNNILQSKKDELAKLDTTISNLSVNPDNIVDVSDIELKRLINTMIKRITYYSYNTNKGVFKVEYLNGYIAHFILVKKDGYIKHEQIFNVPDTFTFNPETMLFNIDVMLQQTEMSFNMVGMFETRYYNYEQLKEAYNIDEWLINKTA